MKDSDHAEDLEFSEQDVSEGHVGDVKFENVCFHYSGKERGNSGGLQNISFHVPPGRMVAIVGASGAGKR